MIGELATAIHELIERGAIIGIQHGDGYETVRAADVQEIRITVRHRSHGDHKDLELVQFADGRSFELGGGG